MKRWSLSRRHLLRGLGASLALPLLDCMAAPSRSDGPVARSVFVYFPNGVNNLDWQVTSAGTDYELSRPLEVLRDLRSQFTLFSGLHHPNGIGHNHKCDKIWLTSSRIEKGEDDFRNGVSVDQLMAERIGSKTRFASLELTITGGTLAWSREGVPLPAERKPGVVFERLFGATTGGKAAARRRLTRRQSVIDAVLEDARRLRKSFGQEDRTKLDEYLSAVRSVELRTAQAEAWLDTPKPQVERQTRERLTRNIPDSAAGDYYDTMYDLMVLALRTDMTRVITCMTGSERLGLALPEIGIPQTRHELSHHNGNPETLRQLTEADSFQTAAFARFLKNLAAHEEQGRSLLDSTMVLFGSGMSYGHSHGNANLPTLLAGGSALGIKHGQHVDYNLPKIGTYDMGDVASYYPICVQPVDREARLSNLLLTMLSRVAGSTQSFGDSRRVLSEILA